MFLLQRPNLERSISECAGTCSAERHSGNRPLGLHYCNESDLRETERSFETAHPRGDQGKNPSFELWPAKAEAAGGFLWRVSMMPPEGSQKVWRGAVSGPLSLHFSPREAKCVRGPSVRGARRLTSGGVLGQYVEHGEQAQRSNGGPVACFASRGEKGRLGPVLVAASVDPTGPRCCCPIRACVRWAGTGVILTIGTRAFSGLISSGRR